MTDPLIMEAQLAARDKEIERLSTMLQARYTPGFLEAKMEATQDALMEIYNNAPQSGKDVSFLIAKNALMHIHIAGRDGNTDICGQCGLDFRDAIHVREI